MATSDSDQPSDGIGYFDLSVDIEPGFVTVHTKGVLEMLAKDGSIRMDCETAEKMGLELLRGAIIAQTLGAINERSDNDEDETDFENPDFGG